MNVTNVSEVTPQGIEIERVDEVTPQKIERALAEVHSALEEIPCSEDKINLVMYDWVMYDWWALDYRRDANLIIDRLTPEEKCALFLTVVPRWLDPETLRKLLHAMGDCT